MILVRDAGMPLEENAEMYRAALDVLDIGVYLVDLERRITFWNAGAERITGYLRAEVLGHACRENILVHCGEHGSVQCELQCPLKHTLEDGKSRQPMMYLRHKQGHRVPVYVRTAVLRDSEGRVMAGAEWFGEQRLPIDDETGGEKNAAQRGREQRGTARPREFMETCLERSLDALTYDTQTFGILEVRVDQWQGLRKTHGKEAAESMMRVLEETLLYTLHSADIFGRWTDESFMVVARDSTVRALELDADLLRGMAASAQVRWWGDLLPVTISIGGTLARHGDTSEALLALAHAALEQSLGRGGNTVTVVDSNVASIGGDECLR
jgi:PAS domain S-box-containing protein/diguanylate cyclase (GGDEF)-like protein